MMKKYIIILLFVALILSGCQSSQPSPLKNGDDCIVPIEYEKTINDYKKVVEFRLSETFEEDWNHGKTVTLNETLQTDLDTPNDESDVSLQYKWDNMIIDMPRYVDTPTIQSFGYILKDLNQDNSPELIWSNSERNVIFAVFTIDNGQAKLLDAYWSKYQATILNTGDIHTLSVASADSFFHNIMKLDNIGGSKTVKSFGKEQDKYYESDDAGTVAIDESRFDKILSEYPFEFGDEWGGEQVITLPSDSE